MSEDEDDFWGVDSNDGDGGERRGGGSGAGELDREWEAREANFWNSGYKDGLEKGRNETIQSGFNIGFKHGAAQGFAWGQARGAISTLQAFAGQLPGTSSKLDAIFTSGSRLGKVPPEAAADGFLQHQIDNKLARFHKPKEEESNSKAKCDDESGDACQHHDHSSPSDVPDAMDPADSWPAVTKEMHTANALVFSFGVQLQPWQGTTTLSQDAADQPQVKTSTPNSEADDPATIGSK